MKITKEQLELIDLGIGKMLSSIKRLMNYFILIVWMDQQNYTEKLKTLRI
jgi:hypothetical protein